MSRSLQKELCGFTAILGGLSAKAAFSINFKDICRTVIKKNCYKEKIHNACLRLLTNCRQAFGKKILMSNENKPQWVSHMGVRKVSTQSEAILSVNYVDGSIKLNNISEDSQNR